MLNYEASVILNAQLPDDQIKTLTDKLQEQLTNGGANIIHVSKWGRRKLAAEIEKATEGYYVIFFFQIEKAGETLTTFERFCRYEDNVLRQMIVSVPMKRRGQNISQIVPEPGWMSDFNMRLRAQGPRRRSEGYDRGPRRPYDRHERPAEPGPGHESAASGSGGNQGGGSAPAAAEPAASNE